MLVHPSVYALHDSGANVYPSRSLDFVQCFETARPVSETLHSQASSFPCMQVT